MDFDWTRYMAYIGFMLLALSIIYIEFIQDALYKRSKEEKKGLVFCFCFSLILFIIWERKTPTSLVSGM